MCARDVLLEKYSKAPSPSNDSRRGEILELIHSDLCGPMPAISLCGYEYYVTFIDDFSRKTLIYFLKIMGGVLDRF